MKFVGGERPCLIQEFDILILRYKKGVELPNSIREKARNPSKSKEEKNSDRKDSKHSKSSSKPRYRFKKNTTANKVDIKLSADEIKSILKKAPTSSESSSETSSSKSDLDEPIFTKKDMHTCIDQIVAQFHAKKADDRRKAKQSDSSSRLRTTTSAKPRKL